jgi:hypothetical protein
MAVVLVLIGGLFGFVSFLIALLGFGTNLATALGVYTASGTMLAFTLCALTWTQRQTTKRMKCLIFQKDSAT